MGFIDRAHHEMLPTGMSMKIIASVNNDFIWFGIGKERQAIVYNIYYSSKHTHADACFALLA